MNISNDCHKGQTTYPTIIRYCSLSFFVLLCKYVTLLSSKILANNKNITQFVTLFQKTSRENFDFYIPWHQLACPDHNHEILHPARCNDWWTNIQDFETWRSMEYEEHLFNISSKSSLSTLPLLLLISPQQQKPTSANEDQ